MCICGNVGDMSETKQRLRGARLACMRGWPTGAARCACVASRVAARGGPMLRASGGAVHFGTPQPALGAPGFGATCSGRG
eukprot:15454921-Alexandrium_andersonii.AAC.1